MKGDLTFNFKINKKIGLALIAAIGLFATAEYVSLIDAKSAGGIVVDGMTDEEVKEVILETMPIGSVTLRMDAVDPSTIYGGTWNLITGDASLRLGNGGANTGDLNGNNEPSVPLLAHNHTMDHKHPIATTNTDSHDHNINLRRSNYTGAAAPSWNSDLTTVTPGITITSGGNYYGDSRGPIDSDSHSHTLDLPEFEGNTGTNGVSNATLDVRGQYVTVNVWQRVG